MNLLIVTQKVDKNDSILGFFHRWIEEFAKHAESLIVICLEEREHNLPANVRVLSLGKEKGVGRLGYLKNFYTYIWREQGNYNAVFVHMNPIYVVLAGVLWRAWGKRLALWYTHKQVDLKLRMAEKLVHNIFTASRESFRLESSKVNIMGHGIDTDVFKPLERKEDTTFKIITIGRISPVKDYETLLKAAEVLKKDGRNFSVTIIGSPGSPSQEEYFSGLKNYVNEHRLDDYVSFLGAISHTDIISYLQESDLFVNMSNTGSLDKAILEAMSMGVPVVTSNEAFEEIFKNFDGLFFTSGNVEIFVDDIKKIMDMSADDRTILGTVLRKEVVNNHNLGILISRLVKMSWKNK